MKECPPAASILSISGDVGWRISQILCSLRRSQHGRDAPFDRNVTIEETERLGDPPGRQIIVSRHGSIVEKGARIQIGVATTIDDKGGQVFACRSILMHVALPLHSVPLKNA